MAAKSTGDGGEGSGRMKENSSEFLNALLTGYKPTKPSRQALRKSRREFKASVRRKVKEDRAGYARLRKSARAAFPGKKKLEALFHEVYGRENPVRAKREYEIERSDQTGVWYVRDANTGEIIYDRETKRGALKAVARLKARDRAKENPLASKRRKSKKKRKNPMPSGLKAYWAKKRRKRARRKATRRSSRRGTYDKRLAEVIAAMKSNPRRRKRRKVSRKPRRTSRPRRVSNPVRKARRITLKGFSASQIRTVANVVRRATGKRVRVVKP